MGAKFLLGLVETAWRTRRTKGVDAARVTRRAADPEFRENVPPSTTGEGKKSRELGQTRALSRSLGPSPRYLG